MRQFDLVMNDNEVAFPKDGYEGLVFDLDGTLVDSMPVHFDAWGVALTEHGAPNVFSKDMFYSMGGRPTKDIVRELNDTMGLSLDPAAVALSKRGAFLDRMETIQLIAPVVAFMKANYGKVPMAIATGGTRVIATKTLDLLGLTPYFKSVVTADDVERGKPDPEVFLKAAKSINVSPENCVAFEDAIPGVIAAQAAGMKVVTIPALSRGES